MGIVCVTNLCNRHIALDCSHLERREQLLEEETSRRAVSFIAKKEQLTKELKNTEVLCWGEAMSRVLSCMSAPV